MTTLNTEQAIRERLLSMVAELDRSVATLAPAPLDIASREAAGASDAGLELADNERANTLVDVAQGQRRHVEAALERLDAGSYGRCIDCGVALPKERLDARPEAARCVLDQSKVEAAAR